MRSSLVDRPAVICCDETCLVLLLQLKFEYEPSSILELS